MPPEGGPVTGRSAERWACGDALVQQFVLDGGQAPSVSLNERVVSHCVMSGWSSGSFR